MAVIAVLGAGGRTGARVVSELRRQGHEVLATGPDAARLPDGDPRWRREIDARDPAALTGLLADAELVVAAAGPDEAIGDRPLRAALDAGVPYLDASLDPWAVHAAYGWDARARAAGVTAVPGAGFPTLPLDLLAHLVWAAVTGGEELHLAVTAPSRGGLRAAAGPGARRSLAAQLGRPQPIWADGALEEEPVGEARRLAWFPRPVGPAHAAGIPAVASVSVPRHVPARTVRTYLALPSWRAELLQAASNAARWAPARRRLQRWGVGSAAPPAPGEAVRWAAVAETHGAEGVARAWANGRDPAALSAVGLVVLAEAVLRGAPAGVLAPAEVAPSDEILDRLAARGDLRWSIHRPG